MLGWSSENCPALKAMREAVQSVGYCGSPSKSARKSRFLLICYPIATRHEELDMKTQITRRTYRIEEAAKLLGVGRNSAYEAAGRGEIPAIRIGKRLVVPKAAFDKMFGIGSDDGGGEVA
jgi:excisionase family DNA binding protein